MLINKRTFFGALAGAGFLLTATQANAKLPNCYPSFLPNAGKLLGQVVIDVPKKFCSSGKAWFKAGKNVGNVVVRDRTCGCAGAGKAKVSGW